jgi:hypothetical protein
MTVVKRGGHAQHLRKEIYEGFNFAIKEGMVALS